MARQASVIGQATDWQGVQWDVRECRPTVHPFVVMIGWPKGELRGQGGRGVAVILTVDLAHYVTNTRPKDIVLPIGGTTVKRLRQMLDLRWSWDAWWQARRDDLMSMTLESFCNKHGCSMGAASQRRAMMANEYKKINANKT